MDRLDWKTLPSLSALRAFDAAARNDSFSSAARSLNVTHAAIAQQVRLLERDLGVELVLRSPGGISLTEAGRRLADATAVGFGRIAQAVDAARRDTRRRLRVTTTTFITDAVILPRIGSFWASHPEIEVSFAPSPRLIDIEAEGFDVAIRTTGRPVDDPDRILLMTSPIIAVASPELARVTTDWSSLGWISHDMKWLRNLLREAGLPDAPERDLGSPGLEIRAAQSGIGPAFGSEIVFRAALRDGSLVRLPIHVRTPSMYYALVRSGPRSEALKQFLEWLVGAFREAETSEI